MSLGDVCLSVGLVLLGVGAVLVVSLARRRSSTRTTATLTAGPAAAREVHDFRALPSRSPAWQWLTPGFAALDDCANPECEQDEPKQPAGYLSCGIGAVTVDVTEEARNQEREAPEDQQYA